MRLWKHKAKPDQRRPHKYIGLYKFETKPMTIASYDSYFEFRERLTELKEVTRYPLEYAKYYRLGERPPQWQNINIEEL